MEPALRDRIAELEEENRQLRALLAPAVSVPAVFGLTRGQAMVFGAILAKSPHYVTYERLYVARYGCSSESHYNNISVMISRTRTKVKPFGVKIHSDRFLGYSIDAESAAIVRGLMAQS